MLIEKLRPDVAMVPDNYAYVDNPLFLPWSQTLSVFRKNLIAGLRMGWIRASGPAWLRRPADNREIAGSKALAAENPAWPTYSYGRCFSKQFTRYA